MDHPPAPALSVALPFFNEEASAAFVLGDLITVLDRADLHFELVAVDNGSRDDTGSILKKSAEQDPRIIPVTVPRNKGYGHGILTGLARCRGDVLGYAWGDGQVSAEDLLRIYRALIRKKADLAKARRVIRHDGPFRLVQTRCYGVVFALLFGRGLHDPNGCPKLFRRELYEGMVPASRDWLLDPEIMVKARRLGARITDESVEFLARKKGRSKVNLGTTIGFFLGLLRMRLFGLP